MASPSSSLTKEQLKNALIQRGVTVPSWSARKEEFQKLYDEKVLPHQARSEFSSDDEQEYTNGGNIVSSPKSKNNSKVEILAEIMSLSDVELYSELVNYGATVGPVVETTRSLYEQMLVNYRSSGASSLNSSTSSGSRNGHKAESENGVNGHGEGPVFSSDEEAESYETESTASKSSRRSTSTPPKKRGRPSLAPKLADVDSSAEDSQGTDTAESADGRTPTPSPQKTRMQRRSETPKSPRRKAEGESVTRLTFRMTAAAAASSPAADVDGAEPYRQATPSRVTRRIVEEGNLSFFKERPGYASTTTSNVLPRKPTPKFNSTTYGESNNSNDKYMLDREEQDRQRRNRTACAYAMVALLLFAAAVVASMYYSRGVESEEPDELDVLLASMSEEPIV